MDLSENRLEVKYQETDSAKVYKTSNGSSFYYCNVISRFEKLFDQQYIREVVGNVRASINFSDEIDIYVHYYNPLDLVPEPIFIQNKERRRILILISDETGSVPTYLTKDFDAVFKNFIPDSPESVPLFPLPAGYSGDSMNSSKLPVNQRGNDVFFSGRIEPHRHELYRSLTSLQYLPSINPRLDRVISRLYLKILRRKKIRRLSNSFIHFHADNFYEGVLDPRSFNELLMNSKIALCPRGRALESFRHIEAARAGCVIFSESLPDHYFYKTAPFVFFDSWKNVLSTIKGVLSDEDLLLQRQNETIAWWENMVSESSVARYIVERSLETMNGR
ncbi:MAG: hypothetical protein O3C43_12735 [Verrucomicrobia bacterium]|nr:hypothetical protein [Verrucomicrobiota bacterium]MDA1067359.1 hypothetical protein [Verrucomicrobiota bacterium]